MADLTKSGTPSLATLTPPPGCQLTKVAASDIAAGDMVYITSADKFALCDGDANDAKAQWWGMALKAAKSGQPCTAIHGVEFNYGSGLTVGARYYVSTNAGALSTTATTGGDVPCAFATDTTNVYVMAPRK